RQGLALLADSKARLELSMLFVTHDLRVALQVCDRIAVMKQGEVVEVAPTAEIFYHPQHPYTTALFAAPPGAKGGASARSLCSLFSRSTRTCNISLPREA